MQLSQNNFLMTWLIVSFDPRMLIFLGEYSKSPTPHEIRVVKITLNIVRWMQTRFAPFTIPDAIAG